MAEGVHGGLTVKATTGATNPGGVVVSSRAREPACSTMASAIEGPVETYGNAVLGRVTERFPSPPKSLP